MTIPIATIIRTALPKDIWESGWSKTYCDTSYTKTKKQVRWASKDIMKMTEAQQRTVSRKLKALLVKTGLANTVWVYANEVQVYKITPITIVE